MRPVIQSVTQLISIDAVGVRSAAWLTRSGKASKSLSVTSSRYYATAVNTEEFMNGTSSNYIEQMYNAWLADPKSVHVSWDAFFRNVAAGASPGQAYQSPPTLVPSAQQQATRAASALQQVKTSPTPQSAPSAATATAGNLEVQALIHAYQDKGHYIAKVDPLGLSSASLEDKPPPELSFSHHGFGEKDMDRVFNLPPDTYIGGKETALPLREILNRLENIYCKHIGSEYMYLTSPEQRDWIRKRLEIPGIMEVSKEEKKHILIDLQRATGFENFLARKWSSERRFGCEGCEVLIAAVEQIIASSAQQGVELFVMGMAHRGRLNVLANVCRRPLEQIFVLFGEVDVAEEVTTGDVKYHLGSFTKIPYRTSNTDCMLSLVANPSHLESADSIILGKSHAEQFYRGDTEGKKVMPIVLHGDAAFPGQGIVAETLTMSYLPDYTAHGTVHIIINNQIGYTNEPWQSRSSPYCTDVAHILKAPIFHVNSDEPEAVIHVCKLAAEWRATYHKDVIIDIVGYRRFGHNETDEPKFTQPLLYNVIQKTKPLLNKYAEKLKQENVVTDEEIQGLNKEYDEICEKGFQNAQNMTHVKYTDWLDTRWTGFFKDKDPLKVSPTGVKEDTLVHIGKIMSSPPPQKTDFVVHKGLERILKTRMEMVDSRTVDWALGEGMAFGSLLMEGIHVRLSGQDVQRGTFSHRHHVIHNQVAKNDYRPLCHVSPNQAPYTVCNSSLSECGVVGFEVGYAMTNPNALVCWEGQFGDFCNGAQTIVDQFISAGEAKWIRQVGVVLLLPHGMEGLGPEHSSARLERFLQLSSDDPDILPPNDEKAPIQQIKANNLIVANCSTPANYFHVLRRQIALPFRKPLILMTPKSLLRHPEAKSSFDDMQENTEFLRIIPDNGLASQNPGNVKKLLFCSGKVYYELNKIRNERKLTEKLAITRIEQISPFPYDLVKKECDKYPQAVLCWAQEEHKNQGAWSYIQPRFSSATGGSRNINYVGRPAAAAPATGNKVIHKRELAALVEGAMAL